MDAAPDVNLAEVLPVDTGTWTQARAHGKRHAPMDSPREYVLAQV